ncbi:MAG: hypothetical protein ACREX9_07025 [Gammaproteobacteria bacterium]
MARKLEFHYTPKHGSWLNIAEIELAVLSNMCLRNAFPPMKPRFEASSRPTSVNATKKPCPSIGASPPRTLGENSLACIHVFQHD